MKETEKIIKFLENNIGETFLSPRSLFGDNNDDKFQIVDLNTEKGYVTIHPEGSIDLPFELTLISKAAEKVVSETVVSIESSDIPGGPVLLDSYLKEWHYETNNQMLNTKYVPYIADLIVLSGVAAYGWAKTPEGEKFRAIAVKEERRGVQKNGSRTRDWDRLNKNGEKRPKVKNGGAYTKDKPEVLVTYATKHGSTADIAWSIGNSFLDSGIKAEVKKIQNVEDVRPYKLVIVGTPIYDNEILPEVISFAQLHQDWLRKRNVALFVVGKTMRDMDDDVILEINRKLYKLKDIVEIIDTGMFAGKISPENLPIKERLGLLLKDDQTGDFRDWREIGNWARELRKKVFPSD